MEKRPKGLEVEVNKPQRVIGNKVSSIVNTRYGEDKGVQESRTKACSVMWTDAPKSRIHEYLGVPVGPNTWVEAVA